MDSNRVNGKVDEVLGSIKRKAGKITGNTPLQVKGIAQQTKGKLESALGKAKDRAWSQPGNRVNQDTRP